MFSSRRSAPDRHVVSAERAAATARRAASASTGFLGERRRLREKESRPRVTGPVVARHVLIRRAFTV